MSSESDADMMTMTNHTDPRIFFAAERTLLAWQRCAIALMGLGFVVERFGLSSQLPASGSARLEPREFSLSIGVGILLLSAVVAAVSARQFRQFLKGGGRGTVPQGYWTHAGVALNAIVALIAVFLAVNDIWPLWRPL